MLKYSIIGAGGVGNTPGIYSQHAGPPVNFLAYGKTLEALKRKELMLVRDGGEEISSPVATSDEASYSKMPDVILLALRSYSIESVLPFLERITTEHTVIIPLYNVFGAGEKLQKKLEKPPVTDGCIYVMGNVKGAGRIRQLGNLTHVVYSARKSGEAHPVLEEVKAKLMRAGVEMVLSDSIRRNCMKRFIYLSPHGAVRTYFYITAAHLQHEDEYRNLYHGLVRRVLAIAGRVGIAVNGYSEADSPKMVNGLTPEIITSLQKDIVGMRKSEVDGLVYEIQHLSATYGVPTPYYDEVIETFRSRDVEWGTESWEKKNAIWQYRENGELATSWKEVDGKQYLFGNGGNMLPGWQKSKDR